jgi:uncharacterized protein (TIGR00369 family)
MSAITEPNDDVLLRTQETAHLRCIVCGHSGDDALGLRFVSCAAGGVEARFACETRFQGYEGIVHGGIVSTLLDGAMTHCLFARGIVALTARMTVRFLQPVVVGVPVVVRAYITDSLPPLHTLRALITQMGAPKADAVGKFVEWSSPTTYRSKRHSGKEWAE